jgi:Phage Mu protein F like protein.
MNDKQYYRQYNALIKKHERLSYQIVLKGFRAIYANASKEYLANPSVPIDLLVNEADTLAILVNIYNSVGLATASMVSQSLPKQKQSSLFLETKAKKPKQYQQTPDQNDQVNYWKQEFLRFTQSKDCAKKVSGVTKTTKEQIRKVMQQSVEEQLSYKQTAKLLLEQADGIDTKKRALLIARTENAVGSNLGAIASAKSSGLVLYKKWICRTGDGKTRDSHIGMVDATPIPLDALFEVGDEKMSHPGDSSHGATAKNICNCRCAVGFIPASEVLQQGINKPVKKPVKPKPTKQPDLFDKPLPLTDLNLFTPASTVGEALVYAVDNGFAKEVNYNWIKDVDVANEMNKTLFDLKKQYGLRSLVNIGKSPKSARALMSANYQGLSINHSIFKSIKTANAAYQKYEVGYADIIKRNIQILESRPRTYAIQKQLNQSYEQLKYNRFTVHYTEESFIADTVTHEYGHILNDQLTGAINGTRGVNKAMLGFDGQLNEVAKELNREAYRNYIKAKSNDDIYKVSYYGSTTKEEFFAETFLMYTRKDPDLPSYIIEFFDKYFALTK